MYQAGIASQVCTRWDIPRWYQVGYTQGGTRVGYTRVVPGWVSLLGVYTSLYASLVGLPYVHTLYMHLVYTSRTALLQGVLTVLFGLSKREGWAGGSLPFLSSGINPSQPGNGPNTSNKPATESHCVQGHRESPNPSITDGKPP